MSALRSLAIWFVVLACIVLWVPRVAGMRAFDRHPSRLRDAARRAIVRQIAQWRGAAEAAVEQA